MASNGKSDHFRIVPGSKLYKAADEFEIKTGSFLDPPGMRARLLRQAMTDYYIKLGGWFVGLDAKVQREFLSKWDMHRIYVRAYETYYLNEKTTPLYNLDELVEIMKSYLEYCNLNETDLIEFGQAILPFDASPWMDRLLGKAHISVEHSLEKLKEFMIGKESLSTSLVEMVNAPRKLRSRLLSVRSAVIGSVIAALEAGSAKDLLDNYVDEIAKEFKADEVRALWWIDDHYHKLNRLPINLTGEQLDWLAGGPIDLAIMVGHVVGEIESGYFANMRNEFADLISPKWPRSGHFKTSDYIDAVMSGDTELIDRGLDLFESMERERIKALRKSFERIGELFDDQLLVKVPGGEYIRGAALAKKTTEEIKAISKQFINRISPDGQLPGFMILPTQAEAIAANPVDMTNKMVFYELDQHITYEGESYRITDEDKFAALLFIARKMKSGHPGPHKASVLTGIGYDKKTAENRSLKSWFVSSKGDTKKFAKKYLTKTEKKGCCKLDIDPKLVMILPAEEEDESQI